MFVEILRQNEKYLCSYVSGISENWIECVREPGYWYPYLKAEDLCEESVVFSLLA